jgi:hypothetical protein
MPHHPPPSRPPSAHKCVGVSATTHADAMPPPPDHPDPLPPATHGGVCDSARRHTTADTPPARKRIRGIRDNARPPCHPTPRSNTWGYMRSAASSPTNTSTPFSVTNAGRCMRQRPPRHAPPAPHARKCVGVSATGRHHTSPATPRRHASNPSHSQTRGGVCDNVPPLQPRDKVRCTLGGDWSRLGSPQTVRPNMLSYFRLLSVTARFGIPRALTLTHLVAFQPPELCGCGFTQWHFSHCICVYFYLCFMSLVAEACLTREPKMVSLTCI